MKPLTGKRIVITRARAQSSELVERIREQGGETIEFPVIRLAPIENSGDLDAVLARIDDYDWVVFTSVNGVKFFLQRANELGINLLEAQGIKIASVGVKTAEALSYAGLQTRVVPEVYQAEALVQVLSGKVKRGERILFPKADIARTVLPDGLRQLGLSVTEVAVYSNQISAEGVQSILYLLRDRKIDYITFTSSSTVTNFVKALGCQGMMPTEGLLKGVSMAYIGPKTAKTAMEWGLNVDILAEEATIDGLVQAIARHASGGIT